MAFSAFIARRYIVSKKSHHVINVISWISVCGVAIATAAMICILSVFNGFQDMVADLFTNFDPELKIVPKTGKFMQADSPELKKLQQYDNIDIYTETLEDNALLMTLNRQVMVTIKGVDDNFAELTDFEDICFGEGIFQLKADVINYGVLGINLLSSLGIGADFAEPIQVYAPRGGERIDMNDPSESFNMDELYSPRVGFSVRQQKYDSKYVITSIDFARNLFEKEGQVSSIELKLKPGVSVSKAHDDIDEIVGENCKVLDRYEQQADTFKIMQIEKLIAYVFLTFILMIACFNIIGSLSMLIIDKKKDVVTLRNLGASESRISRIFMHEGSLISLVGALGGILMGLGLCFIQQEYGIIKFGESAGNFIIDSYPVSIHLMDVVVVFVTVLIVGFISVWLPVKYLSKKYTRSESPA